MPAAIKVGDKVMTIGGVIGKVSAIKGRHHHHRLRP